MMRGHFASDAQALLLGAPHVFERSRGRKMRDVQTAAGKRGDFNVASHADRFRRSRHALQSQSNGSRTFAHHTTRSQRNVLAMIDYRQAQRAAVLHGLAEQPRGGHGFSVVADGYDSRILHCRDFSQCFAFAPDGRGADRPNAHRSPSLRAINHETSDGSVVVDRLGIGHRADRRKASTSRGTRAGLDGFREFLAGHAQVAMQVNKSGSDDQAGGVENFRAVRREARAQAQNPFPVDQNIQGALGAARGIHDAPVLNQKHAIPLLGVVCLLPAH